jgi:cysteine synthase
MWLNNILETIGNTPLIKLNKITKDLKLNIALFLLKIKSLYTKKGQPKYKVFWLIPL